jgi:hypothetical protein
MDPIKVHTCLEPLPEGWTTPSKWKKVSLATVLKA